MIFAVYIFVLGLALAAILVMVGVLMKIIDNVKTPYIPPDYHNFGDGERELIGGRWVRRRDE